LSSKPPEKVQVAPESDEFPWTKGRFPQPDICECGKDCTSHNEEEATCCAAGLYPEPVSEEWLDALEKRSDEFDGIESADALTLIDAHRQLIADLRAARAKFETANRTLVYLTDASQKARARIAELEAQYEAAKIECVSRRDHTAALTRERDKEYAMMDKAVEKARGALTVEKAGHSITRLQRDEARAEVERLRDTLEFLDTHKRTKDMAEIRAKCEQYWNEPAVCAEELHVILEFIHRRAHNPCKEGGNG